MGTSCDALWPHMSHLKDSDALVKDLSQVEGALAGTKRECTLVNMRRVVTELVLPCVSKRFHHHFAYIYSCI